MFRHVRKSLVLLASVVVIVCGLYPAVLWVIGQTAFPFQANGSMVKGPDGKLVGSLLIAQPFTKDEYFQPRPSAVSYDASASGSSSLAPTNYTLRDRVARAIAPVARYASGPQAGQVVGPDVERWFQADRFQGQPHLVAQWAQAHNSLAQAWVTGSPTHTAYVDAWAKAHSQAVAAWVKDNPGTPQPKPADLAVPFFVDVSQVHPGMFPVDATHPGADGKPVASVEFAKDGSDIQAIFFDMWRQDHPQADLAPVPGDMVTASASGLDPDITLINAMFQLDRVAAAWARDTKRDGNTVHREIADLLTQHAKAPLSGLAGEPMVNVLAINLELRKRYGAPAT
ncbi:potassium-transporting ATPase subunit C [uncultured Ralstonia sp.]|jgi:K+-transporting ATPase ATPase C chain|uniref:potassium-transporting ATPase subunit C n=1 Tax=Ralstonia sp. TaxID=54061 RepID=UPI001EA8CD9B|nr:potassium-transporting ATPase subunit C [uncultured Ralstonia sp.]UCF22944.1 MAG: potassium-transporting ATPase subunit C [Ralstonia sp.]